MDSDEKRRVLQFVGCFLFKIVWNIIRAPKPVEFLARKLSLSCGLQQRLEAN